MTTSIAPLCLVDRERKARIQLIRSLGMTIVIGVEEGGGWVNLHLRWALVHRGRFKERG